MTHTHTTKLSLLGMIVVGLFLFGLTFPAHAENHVVMSGHASTTGMTASSTRDRNRMHERDLHSSSTNASSTRDGRGRNVDASCVLSAVDVREGAIATAWTTFTSSITSALSARKTALDTAWGMTDVKARNGALMAAWMSWRTADKSAHTGLKAARKSSWETFKTTMKTSCKVPVPKDEGLDNDGQGSISL